MVVVQSGSFVTFLESNCCLVNSATATLHPACFTHLILMLNKKRPLQQLDFIAGNESTNGLLILDDRAKKHTMLLKCKTFRYTCSH